MIEKLTSELNRINQGCGDSGNVLYIGKGHQKCGLEDLENKGQIWLCPTCQKEKETLKKVSLMWADEELVFIKEILRLDFININVIAKSMIEDKIQELQEIKSLMEKA